MRMPLYAAAAGLALLGLAVQSALAITGGEVDAGNRYSNVGAILIVKNASGVDRPVPRVSCTGTLIHPRVLLTAGHCTHVWETAFADPQLGFSPDNLRVSFGVDSLDPSTWLQIEGVITHPDFDPRFINGFNQDLNDVGVVILKEPVFDLPLATLPDVGLLDALKEAGQLRQPGDGGAKFTVAGYGVTLDFPPPLFPPLADGLRRVARSEYLALTGDWLYLSQNFATGNGGTGFGDSGGPTFWIDPETGTDILVSITSRGDPVLVNTGVTQRIDIPESLLFIELVLALFD